MNAVLAKPIHAIWFIPARKVDLHQSLAAPLRAGLPFWLRDHTALFSSTAIAASHNQNIFQRAERVFMTKLSARDRNCAIASFTATAPESSSLSSAMNRQRGVVAR